jgi:hypothetical protein
MSGQSSAVSSEYEVALVVCTRNRGKALRSWLRRRGKYGFRPVVFHHHGRKPGTERLTQLLRSYAFARGSCYMKCLLQMPQRKQCILCWTRSMRRRSWRTVFYEILGALLYLLHLFHKRLCIGSLS